MWSLTKAYVLIAIAPNKMAAFTSVRGTRPLANSKTGTTIPKCKRAEPTIAKIRIRFFFI